MGAGGRKWHFFVILKHVADSQVASNCLFIPFGFNANKKEHRQGTHFPTQCTGGGQGAAEKSVSDRLLLVRFPTTRPHCSHTLAAEGAHPRLSGRRDGDAG